MISAHYYSPWDFAGEENGNIAQWGATATNPAKKSTWGQEDYLESQFKSMYDKFVTQGYPVVIGEFGAIDKAAYDSTNNVYRAAFAKAVTKKLKRTRWFRYIGITDTMDSMDLRCLIVPTTP
ncbi:cellulase family glycosylhydrolase [Paenibacillus sp. OK076]|uniref:cellulase family glycosylhydrolase n=1 Tax=Paenibacillus sp. OK076 TaxID=1884379 RepID=UPI000A425FAD|nr:cellulase family glycosylhydrolase [Paenibacillus sp. OK076]